MFKKKGGVAFKPKVPQARPKPEAAPDGTPVTETAPPPTEIQAQSPAIAPPPATSKARTQNAAPEAKPAPIARDGAPPAAEPASAGDRAVDTTQDVVVVAVGERPDGHAEDPRERMPAPTARAPVTEVRPGPQRAARGRLVAEGPSPVPATPTASTEPLQTEPQPPPRQQPSAPDVASPPLLPPPPTQPTSAPVSETTAAPPSRIQPNSEAPPLLPSPPSPQPAPAPAPASAPKPRGRKKQVPTAGEYDSGADASPQPRKLVRKARATAVHGNDAEPPPHHRRKRSSTGNRGDAAEASRPKRQRRAPTPDDAEMQVVDRQSLTMADLTRDLHIGKKFSRHEELRTRERDARTKKKPDELGLGRLGTPASGPDADKDDAFPASAKLAASGPQFQIVDGQIVVDQSSLAFDRHARADAALGDLEEIEENDFTKLVTCASYRTGEKLKGPNTWNEPDTQLFYRGLSMFGTDFETIAKMFPGRTRRHVKMKFNREERKAPGRVNATLMGEKRVRMDMKEYQSWTGLKFEAVGDIMAAQEKRQAEYDAEAKRVTDEQEEALRKKREELFRDGDEAEGKKKKKKGKKKGRLDLGGEEVSVEPA